MSRGNFCSAQGFGVAVECSSPQRKIAAPPGKVPTPDKKEIEDHPEPLAYPYLKQTATPAITGRIIKPGHLGWCEVKLGQTAQAKETLQKALDLKAEFKDRGEAQKLLESLTPGKS